MSLSWQGRIMKVSSQVASRYQQRQSLMKQRQQEFKLAQLQPRTKAVQITEMVVFGQKVEKLQATKAPNKVICYVHGGAYLKGSSLTHRGLTSRLAQLSQAFVYVMNYSLAPETPFPGALAEMVSFYEWLQQQHQMLPIHVVGDSAGGGLAFAMIAVLRDQQRRLPQSLTTFSPWVDLSFRLQRTQLVDPIITLTVLQQAAKLYASGYPAESAKISPLFEELNEFPPTLIQVGADEVLLADSIAMIKKLKAYGVVCEFEIFPEMWHVFQLATPFVPESEEAISKVVKFIEKYN
ncbi:MAG: alpha/beta hydrolase [Culicoidibacterales bacterium]